jgi:hypothetical protein
VTRMVPGLVAPPSLKCINNINYAKSKQIHKMNRKQGYQSSMRDAPTQDDDNEALLSPVHASGHIYVPTAYETAMSRVGNVLGSICCCLAYQSVNRGEVGLVTQYGRYIKSYDEGLHYVNMITQRMISVDTKRTTHALTEQTVVTADNLQVSPPPRF